MDFARETRGHTARAACRHTSSGGQGVDNAFADDAAFAAHQQTDAFKTLVVGHALPKLARRERVQLTPFLHESTIAP